MSGYLEDSMKDEILSWLRDGNSIEDIGDLVHELADSNVPVYTGDLIEAASHDIYLATNAPELGPAFDGSPTPANIIAANYYEFTLNDLWEYIKEIEEDYEQEVDDIEYIVESVCESCPELKEKEVRQELDGYLHKDAPGFILDVEDVIDELKSTL